MTTDSKPEGEALESEQIENCALRDRIELLGNPRTITIATLLSLAKDLAVCNDGDHNFLRIAADVVEKHMPATQAPPAAEGVGEEALTDTEVDALIACLNAQGCYLCDTYGHALPSVPARRLLRLTFAARAALGARGSPNERH